MKTSLRCLCASLIVFAGVSCSSRGSVDTTAVVEAFDLVQGQVRPEVEDAVKLVKHGEYAAALKIFREIEQNYRLSTEQIVALREIIPKLEQRAPGAAQPPATAVATSSPSARP